ncbi:DUF4190 domain-containing protein [Egicoccus sp. AB-alg6-2]|uniref:DUF4190 domain-containing protein n=1 Tax=Egicoccus sp. AB-alg6-2 TaxID=3242692 RepID=UPI00359E3CCE
MSSPAAWHPDPTRKHDHRWWDGTKWTEHVADAGESKIDHLAPGDAPPAPTGGVPPTAEPDPDITTGGSSAYGAADAAGHGGLAGGAASGTGAGADAGAEGGAGGRPGAWEGTADPDQGQRWQQPGAGDPHDTARQPAWQQGPGSYQQGSGAYQHDDAYGQQPAWDQGGQAYSQRAQSGTDGVAIAALVIGILSLLTSWFVLGGLGGVIALILGFVALGRIKRNRSGGRGMAITGIVTGVLSIVVAILVVIFAVGFFGDAAAEYEQCLQENSEEFCNEQLEQGILERFSN